MAYTVTICNDNKVFGNGGVVHTWLEFNNTGTSDPPVVYSYGPERGPSGTFNGEGTFHGTENPTRITQSVTITVSQAQYEAMINRGETIKNDPPMYDAFPYNDFLGDDNDSNCVTVSDVILSAGGINVLDDYSHPNSVAECIDAINSNSNIDTTSQ